MKIDENLKKLIEENALAFATTDENGNPHCIAVGDVKVVSENQVLIGDIFIVETTKNIQKNKNVALVVWSRNWEKECMGYELKGTAEHFKDGEYFKKVKEIHKDFKPKGAILVTISEIKKLV